MDIAASETGNPMAAPTQEEDKPMMVSSKGPLKPSSSAVNLHGISLTEDELQEKISVSPADNTSKVVNPPPSQPTASGMNETSRL